MYICNVFNTIGKIFGDLYVMIRDFFIECWHVYFDFVINVFGKDLGVGITIVLGFVIGGVIFMAIINSANSSK